MRIRELCVAHLPDHEEAMQRGMPVYRRAGTAESAGASQARYISLYIMKSGVVAANAVGSRAWIWARVVCA